MQHKTHQKTRLQNHIEIVFLPLKLSFEDEKEKIRSGLLENLDKSIKAEFHRFRGKAKEKGDKHWMRDQLYRVMAKTRLLVAEGLGDEAIVSNLISDSLTELTGGGVCSKWIVIDGTGQLRNGKKCDEKGIDSLEFFNFFIKKTNTQEYPIKGISPSFIDKLESVVVSKYNAIDDEIEPKDIPCETRILLIQLMESIETLFSITNDPKYNSLLKGELQGSGKLHWLKLDNDELKNISAVEFLNFDAAKLLMRLNNESSIPDLTTKPDQPIIDLPMSPDNIAEAPNPATQSTFDFNEIMNSVLNDE